MKEQRKYSFQNNELANELLQYAETVRQQDQESFCNTSETVEKIKGICSLDHKKLVNYA